MRRFNGVMFALWMGLALVGCTDAEDASDGEDGDLNNTENNSNNALSCEDSCDDGVACTVDACVDGSCTHEPDDSRCDDGEACSTEACVPDQGCMTTANACACTPAALGQPCVVEGAFGLCAAGETTCTDDAITCAPSSTPEDEVCDGIDNDCDGDTDEDDPEQGEPCDTGLDGVCRQGERRCQGGALECAQQVGASGEVCDGIDNDCDGDTDEDDPALGIPCTVDGAEGPCLVGAIGCAGGALACVSQATPSDELCNDLDDDCDGEVDEDATGAGELCAVDGAFGVCAQGRRVCLGGALNCQADALPGVEVCNGLDDDCDGDVDDHITGAPCTLSDLSGECARGAEECLGAQLLCTQLVGPATEVCNGLDDDCDGATDETFPEEGTCALDALAGPCRNGAARCSDGALLCEQAVFPQAERCGNEIDDNCNGAVDENPPCTCVLNSTRSCYTGPRGTSGVGTCRSGTQTCLGDPPSWGACIGQVLPVTEVCDGVDNDCDGARDEALTRTCGTTQTGACELGLESCMLGTWQGCTAIGPTDEICNNQDDDCDGTTDRNTEPCYTGPAATRNVGRCRDGSRMCTSGAWAACTGAVLPTAEICNNQDDDCDGATDEDLLRACYSGPTATRGVGLCHDGTQSCTQGAWGTCQTQTLPANEACDELDNDCDGATDEATDLPWPASEDGESNDTFVVAHRVGVINANSTVRVDSSWQQTDTADCFWWEWAGDFRTERHWMCRTQNANNPAQIPTSIGAYECGDSSTWSSTAVLRMTPAFPLLPGQPVSGRVLDNTSCTPARMIVCISRPNGTDNCNARYTVECRLDNDGVW